MSVHLYRVTAVRDYGKLASGMWVEIVIRNSTRTPNQREVIDAINDKYGRGTAMPGLSLRNFDIRKM